MVHSLYRHLLTKPLFIYSKLLMEVLLIHIFKNFFPFFCYFLEDLFHIEMEITDLKASFSAWLFPVWNLNILLEPF